MKAFVSLFVVASFFIAFHVATAQDTRNGGWGPGSKYQKLYNPETVETLQGEVTNVELTKPMKGMSGGVHLLFKTEKETISVHVGPQWYVDKQEMKFAQGDQLKVTGSRVTYEEKPAIIASEIHKGENVLKLRDEKGYPVWAGWRRR